MCVTRVSYLQPPAPVQGRETSNIHLDKKCIVIFLTSFCIIMSTLLTSIPVSTLHIGKVKVVNDASIYRKYKTALVFSRTFSQWQPSSRKHLFIVSDIGTMERGGQTPRLTFMWILKSLLASNNYSAHASCWDSGSNISNLIKCPFHGFAWYGGNFKHIFKWSNHHFVMAVSHDLESTYLESF